MARFLRDIKDGNLVAVERALANNPSVIRAKEPGTERTALHLAAQYQRCEAIDLLLNANAPSDQKDSQGAVPLHIAVQTGNPVCVAALLGRGNKVAIKFKNNIGYTPLHLAAKLGHTRVVAELLAVGANAALKDQRGKTPADHVPRIGNFDELMEMLRFAAAENPNGRAGAGGPAAPRTPLSSPPARTRSSQTPTSLWTGSPANTPNRRPTVLSPQPSTGARTGRALGFRSSPPAQELLQTEEQALSTQKAAFQEAVRHQEAQTRQALKQAADIQQQVKTEQAAHAQQQAELAVQRANLQQQATEQAAQLQRQEAQFREQQQALLQQQAAAKLEEAQGARAENERAIKGLHSKVADLESALDENSAAVRATNKLAVTVRDTQADMAQHMRVSIIERQEELSGETVSKVAAIEGRMRAHAAAQEHVQSQLSELESRLSSAENARLRVEGMVNSNEPIAPEILLKVEALERNLRASEQRRYRATSPGGNGMPHSFGSVLSGNEDDSHGGDEATAPRSPMGNGIETKEARLLRKQGDQLSNLQRKFATLEGQMQSYNAARDDMDQEEMQTPEFMAALRAQLEEACSATSSDPSSASTSTNVVLRGSEQMGNGHVGPSISPNRMAAIVAALEGLTKEVGLVRCRTAQLGLRAQSTDTRVSIVEDQYAKIRMKMRQMREWFNLGLPQKSPTSSVLRSRSRSRGPVDPAEMTPPRTSETRAAMQPGPASLRSQRSLSSLHNADSLSVASMHFN